MQFFVDFSFRTKTFSFILKLQRIRVFKACQVYFAIGGHSIQDPAARRATAAATRSVSRERFGLGTAIRILDEMKFPTLD